MDSIEATDKVLSISSQCCLLEMDRRGYHTSETAVRRVMRRFGIAAIFPGRNLSKASKYHKKYPYLLKDKVK